MSTKGIIQQPRAMAITLHWMEIFFFSFISFSSLPAFYGSCSFKPLFLYHTMYFLFSQKKIEGILQNFVILQYTLIYLSHLL